jgi:regulatory protein SWI6
MFNLTSTVMSGILQSASMQFTQEARLKQDSIDRTNDQIAQLSAHQKSEQQRLETLRARIRARQDREKRIANIQQWVDFQRKSLAITTGELPRERHEVGHADYEVANFDLASSLPPQLLAAGDQLIRKASDGPAYISTPIPLDTTFLAQQHAVSISTLPSITTLRQRLEVYIQNNQGLAQRRKLLKEKDGQLEVMYRKVVSLCTKVDEDRVDSVLEGLVQALDSDPLDGVEVGRVREFLRKVEGVE